MSVFHDRGPAIDTPRYRCSTITRAVRTPINDRWELEVIERLWVDVNPRSPKYGTEVWLKESQTPAAFCPTGPVERVVAREVTAEATSTGVST